MSERRREPLPPLRRRAERLRPGRLAPALAVGVRVGSLGRPALIRGPPGGRRARSSRPRPTATRSTVPSRGARSSFCIFIASTTRSVWPAVDRVAGRDRDRGDPPGDDRTDLESARCAGSASRGRGSPARGGRLASASSTSSSKRQPSTTTSTVRRPSAASERADPGSGHRAARTSPTGARAARRSTSPASSSGSTSIVGGRPASTRSTRPGAVSSRPPVDGFLAAGVAPARSVPGRSPRCGAMPAGRRRVRQPPRRRPRQRPPARPGRATRVALGRSVPALARPSRSTGRPAGTRGRGPRSGGTAGSSGSRPTSVSSRARPSRSMAASRSASTTMILAISGS